MRSSTVGALALLLGACGSTPPARKAVPSVPPSAGVSAAPDLTAGLSDVDLVGQLLMPYAYGSAAASVSAGSAAANRKLAGVDTPAEMITKYHVGGLILVGFSADDPTASTQATTNVDNPSQVHKLTTGLQQAAATLPVKGPLLIATDQEYGVVTRITKGVTQLPSAMAFGAAHDPKITTAAWKAAGSELAAMGINVDFAPDADVLGSKAGGPIGSRSFGAATKDVGAQVGAAVTGLQSAGVAATLKHFPGHGLTIADSHTSLPVLAQSRATLEAHDLPAFTAGIKAGAQVVMSGHLDVQAVDPGVPASFSHKIMTDLLRQQLGFRGVLVTDALNMEPAQRWPAPEAAVRAVLAGNDLLLMPPDLAGAQKALLAAVKSGRISRARLLEAAGRVLALKATVGAAAPAQLDNLESADHQQVVSAVDAAAVTQLRGACGGPLVRGSVSVTTSNGRGAAGAALAAALRRNGVTVTAHGGKIIHLVGYGDERGDLNPDAAVTVAMDTPYLLAEASSPYLLATYSSSPLALTALARVIAGQTAAPGEAPVAVPGLPRTSCG